MEKQLRGVGAGVRIGAKGLVSLGFDHKAQDLRFLD